MGHFYRTTGIRISQGREIDGAAEETGGEEVAESKMRDEIGAI
jgi:hypothetical protein